MSVFQRRGSPSEPARCDPITGAEYVKQLSLRESDRRTRAAFQRLALSLVPPGGRIFDFGAGTGADARCYAEHGLTVSAFDHDPRMRAFFGEYCQDFIASGRVRLQGGDYRDFLADDPAAPAGTDGADLVTANFAPLSLVTDLRELFGKFHALTRPRGRVLASVLSPYFLGDVRYGWWWKNLGRLWREGSYAVQGAQGPVIRRRLAELAAQALPYFTLHRVFSGLPRTPSSHTGEVDPWDQGIDVRDGPCAAWHCAAGSLFIFLVFEKQSIGA